MALAHSTHIASMRQNGTQSESILRKNLSETCLKAFRQLRTMPRNLSKTCLSSGLQLNYDTFGDHRNPAVLLIMGVAAQKVRWPSSFCQRVADAGYYVIRFDNRDCGSSGRHFVKAFERISCLLGLPLMVMTAAMRERWKYLLVIYSLFGRIVWTQKRRRYRFIHALVGVWSCLSIMVSRLLRCPYSCEDMARDCVELLDKLGVVNAHIIGFSMGGMIAQIFAREHSRRCLSLVLLSTCHPSSQLATANVPFLAMHALTTGDAFHPLADESRRQKALERFWKNLSTRESHDSGAQRKLALEELSRGSMDIDACLRQVMAVLKFTDGRQARALAEGQLPHTLVIHGADDPLIPIQHGLELAKLMKCKNCVVLPSYGHDVLPGAEDEIYQAIMAHFSDVICSTANKFDTPYPAAMVAQRAEAAQQSWAALKKSPSVALLTLESSSV
mmetsp:Transcript_93798/g.148121  ORF Transcript_93798/g.148121 Transcript_93798/m.148121 type:complete len:444 (+) Transcript_93798:68-1399(+)